MSSVLFVCLGNICRSPMAEGLLRHRLGAAATGWDIDSAGTSREHAGEGAHPQTQALLARLGADFPHRSRQVTREDFTRYRWLVAMDLHNVADLQAIAPRGATAKIVKMLDPTGGGDVPDPWSHGPDRYEHVRRLLDAALDVWVPQWMAED